MSNIKEKSTHEGKKFLQEAFAYEQKLLQAKLELSSQTITHAGSMGEASENHFLYILRKYLPNRYAIDSGIVIDSNGMTSDQIDAIIYDSQYTPTLLDQESHRYVPAEAVYAVFEVKPTINKQYLEYAGEKAESVRKLHRTSVPIVHAGGQYPAKPLFPIIAGIVAGKMDWTDGFSGKAFIENHSNLKDLQVLDCGLAVDGDSFDVFDGTIRAARSENALAYFIFRLLQKLQTLGTVPAIDWNSYATALSNSAS
jgi:hypothetical protein